MRAPLLILAIALGLGVAASLWLRPWNPEYFADRAEEVLDRRGAAGRAEAVDLFRQALAREPASPYRWCDLGETLADAGQAKTAEYCFKRAVELGPRIPPILMRAANFHFAAGRNAEALVCTRRILSMVREYDGIVFATYERMGVAPEQVLDNGLPPGAVPRQAYFRNLLGTGDLREPARVWSCLERGGFADTGIATEYCSFLLEHHEYARAEALWADYQGGRSPGYPQTNRVFNGGFESEPAGTGLDWRISATDGVVVERASTPTHGGAYSLRVTFSGATNPAYGGVVERAVVEPGTYRFRAFIRAARGPSLFRASSSREPTTLTNQPQDAKGTRWTQPRRSQASWRLVFFPVARVRGPPRRVLRASRPPRSGAVGSRRVVQR